jgi:RNA recognition motif-containing protein
VESAKVITDKFTGRPRGFGFVEMSSGGGGEAQRAIQALNGTELDRRTLRLTRPGRRKAAMVVEIEETEAPADGTAGSFLGLA